jgi:hypothetical protein
MKIVIFFTFAIWIMPINLNAQSGIITTIAGNGTFASTGDGGLATDAEVSNISVGACDNNGNYFFF